MEKYDCSPDIIDFAYQIIELHKENEQLRSKLDHYKKNA
jgi:hypothetical protein